MAKTRMHIAIDSALKAGLEAEAQKQRRSLNNLIELILAEWKAQQ